MSQLDELVAVGEIDRAGSLTESVTEGGLYFVQHPWTDIGARVRLIHPPSDKLVAHETRGTRQGDPQPAVGSKGGLPFFL